MVTLEMFDFWVYPLVNVYITMENHPVSWDRPTRGFFRHVGALGFLMFLTEFNLAVDIHL